MTKVLFWILVGLTMLFGSLVLIADKAAKPLEVIVSWQKGSLRVDIPLDKSQRDFILRYDKSGIRLYIWVEVPCGVRVRVAEYVTKDSVGLILAGVTKDDSYTVKFGFYRGSAGRLVPPKSELCGFYPDIALSEIAQKLALLR